MSKAQTPKPIPALVETGRITNVDIERWSVDAVSEHAGKQWFDIQVMNPYLHYMNGEGSYTVPEVGAMVWVCSPSSGEDSTPFILGYQAPHDEDNDSFRCGRQSLNPGDIVMRTRDENFIIVRRGGVVQIGATPTAQRMYIPIGNLIRDFCENYELNTFGGELLWETGRSEDTTEGDALTKFSLLAKEKADNDGHIAELTIGSHGEDTPTTMVLVIKDSGLKDAETMISLEMTKEGDVGWLVENGFSLDVKDVIQIHSREGDITIDAGSGNINVEASSNMVLTAGSAWDVDCVDATVKASSSTVVDCSSIKLGGSAAFEPAVLGNQLLSILNSAFTIISTHMSICPICGASIPVVPAPSLNGIIGQLSMMLAQKVKVE